MNKLPRPRVIITPGEPAGIGPELVIQLAQQTYPAELVVVADQDMMLARAELINLPLKLVPYNPNGPKQIVTSLPPSSLSIIHVPAAVRSIPGQLNTANAQYVVNTLQIAAEKCLNKEFSALVTGPVHKGMINSAGIPFQGHTEFFAQCAGVAEVVMMLATDDLRVALLTTHIPLAQVPLAITPERLRTAITILDQELKRYFAINNPRILVCGLNPHAGEDGYMGREEIDIMQPVISECIEQGVNVVGPLSADTIFTDKYVKSADVILAMYHDQGLPALKARGFGLSSNITLGLPFIRTSVDHGTALELAGTGKASSSSLDYALRTAIGLVENLPPL